MTSKNTNGLERGYVVVPAGNGGWLVSEQISEGRALVGSEVQRLKIFMKARDGTASFDQTYSISFFNCRMRILEMIGNHVSIQAFKQRAEPKQSEFIAEFYAATMGRSIRPVDEAQRLQGSVENRM